MQHLLENVLMAAADYWWLLLIAIIVVQFMGAPDPLDAKIRGFKPENSHGGAVWAENNGLKRGGLFKGKGVPIGYSPDGRRPLHYPGVGHILTVAAARTGKGATLLINALLSWTFGCIIIDPKCENALVTAHFRKRLGPVYILNPFKMFAEDLGSMFAKFNPMSIISTETLSFHADTDKLAAALVWNGEGQDGQHWTTAARILVSGVIAALVRHAPPAERNLVEVARIISGGGLYTFCREVVASTKDPFLKSKLERFALPEGREPSREMNDVVSTAITQLAFLGNAAVAESLSGSDFRFRDVRKRSTVFICLPLSKLDICDKYFRLILETALSDLLNEGTKI